MSFLINQINSGGIIAALGFTPVAISGTGNIQVEAGVVKDIPANISSFTPTTGQTITLVKGTNKINPSGALLALTVAMPTSPQEGDIVRMVYTQAITTLGITSASTIYAAITTAIIGTSASWQYIGAAWYKIG